MSGGLSSLILLPSLEYRKDHRLVAREGDWKAFIYHWSIGFNFVYYGSESMYHILSLDHIIIQRRRRKFESYHDSNDDIIIDEGECNTLISSLLSSFWNEEEEQEDVLSLL
jgi:hypothetical protein